MSYLIFRRLTLRTPGLPFGRNDVTPSSRCHYQTLQYGLLPLFALDFNADSPSSVNNIDVTVFLVSLKAGGVALNLTEASRVYLMDSWWNPAVSTPLALHVRFLINDFNCRLNIVCFVSSKDELNLNLLTEAMDRIHRLGQRRPVQAIKLVVEDSIESRIVQVSFIPVLTDNHC